MQTLLSKLGSQGWSDAKTSTIVILGCMMVLLFTLLPQNVNTAGKTESQDLLSFLPDHGLLVLNELVDLDSDFTLFSPSKKALGKLLKSSDSKDITEFFEGHIVYNERIFTSAVPEGGASFKTAKGTTIFLETKEKRGKTKMMVQGVPVLFDNIVVGPKGVVHIIKGTLSTREKAEDEKKEEEKKKEAPKPAAVPREAKPTAQQKQAAVKPRSPAQKKSESPAPIPKPKGRAKQNPFDERNHFKYRNMNTCRSHGFVGEDGKCNCAALYEGHDCGQVKNVPFKRIVGHSPIVFNKQKFQSMSEIMVRTEAKTLTMLPRVTNAAKKSIMAVLPQDDPFHGRVFNVCSLVGSSGSLLYFENGPEIDRSDLVIRFNHAPSTMYEKHVGSRTDLRISNGEHLGFNEKGNEKSLHHLRSKSFLARMMLYEKAFGKKRDMPYLVHPGFTEYVANASLPYIASSGYFAILMAMEVCSHVNLYGFHSSFNQGSRHHYFNNEVPANVKRDTSEYERLKVLEDHGLLKFAEPCLHECYVSSQECEACFGMPMAKVSSLQKLSREQIKMAENLEKERLKFRQWEGPLKREWELDDVKGLIKKETPRGGGRRRGGSRNRRRRRGSRGRSSGRPRSGRGSNTNVNVNINLPKT